jgi:hypothetical protein
LAIPLLFAAAASPASGATTPKVGGVCKKAQVGLAASNGLVCTKVAKRYLWRKPAGSGGSAATVPAAVPTAATVGSVAIGQSIWFAELNMVLASISTTDTKVVLDTRSTFRGVTDRRLADILNEMDVVVSSPTGKVQLFADGSLVANLSSQFIFSSSKPSGFSLAGATIVFGDFGGNDVTVPLGGVASGSLTPSFDAVTGSGPLTFQTTASRGAVADAKVLRSIVRPNINAGKKGQWEVLMELSLTATSVSGNGVNVDDSMFALNGVAAVCCPDLESLIVVVDQASVRTGWLLFRFPEKPSQKLVLSVIKDGAGSIDLNVAT